MGPISAIYIPIELCSGYMIEVGRAIIATGLSSELFISSLELWSSWLSFGQQCQSRLFALGLLPVLLMPKLSSN